MTGLSARCAELASRQRGLSGFEPAPEPDDPPPADPSPLSASERARMAKLDAGRYQSLGWEGLARMAWARAAAGAPLDALDRMATERVGREEAAW